MRVLLGALLASAAVALTGPTPAAADAKDTPAKLDGTYRMVAIEVDGFKITEDMIKASGKAEEQVLTIKGTQILTKKDGKDETSTFKLDATKTPGQIDLTVKKGDKDETAYGIYKVDGDLLTLCVVEGDPKARPTEFKAKGKVMILTLKKQK